jgi:hypothetical protein
LDSAAKSREKKELEKGKSCDLSPPLSFFPLAAQPYLRCEFCELCVPLPMGYGLLNKEEEREFSENLFIASTLDANLITRSSRRRRCRFQWSRLEDRRGEARTAVAAAARWEIGTRRSLVSFNFSLSTFLLLHISYNT